MTILLFICLVPILLIASATIWWLFILERQRRWLSIGMLCWLGAHYIFLIPFQGLAYAFVVLYGLALGVPVAIFCALTFFDRRNDYFRIATLLIWLSTPLTLPGIMLMRDLPPTEVVYRCLLEDVGEELELYYNQHQYYPKDISFNTFLDAAQLQGIENSCASSVGQRFYVYSRPSIILLYEKKEDTYALGGYYHYFLLDLVGLTQVCHYDQTTKDVACGLNNWAPFSPP